MHIILTHEQADFDALASLLGAHLLEEHALPVLPRRLNRNVRAFITLYGLDLPFVDPRDLPKKKINTVTLVDTQSMVTLKGIHKGTKVYVIDHHPERPDLPEDWNLDTQDTGATATLLVETIQERDLQLSVPQATLLLLGIYEDTGGLTYTRTTARDLKAAAYLMEQGGSVKIAAEFLNHPLSHEQQAIYDQLLKDVTTHTVFGSTVMIAAADAADTDEELSTLAHKLRDVLDPDALFLLIFTGGGVQLIARATTDLINVSVVAAHFGGGGHPRAAAALVKDQAPDNVRAELVALLPKYVQPGITVAEIMSQGPKLLTPDTSVKEVGEQMQRYGYEGYPVVKSGQVIGLVTRRAVDRTLSHKLNLKVKEIMKAGSTTIYPGQSIEDLQKLMTQTGWGQIPVVDPEDGNIVGIVTRTDLLKTMTPEDVSPGRQNLANRLEESLPPARLALLFAVSEIAQAEQAALYIVGGFVRDLLLKRPSIDYDLVVEGDAIALGHALVKKFGGRVTTHKRFGTAKWQILDIRPELAKKLGSLSDQPLDAADFPETLDLVSARREFYAHPTALPTVERGSIKLDLHRRDFTINTLALRLDGHHYGQLDDYWGGHADLENGIVRVLHSLSFVDDPTRILRAVRFEQRFGYQIEDRTQEFLVAAQPLVGRVSGDRLRHELNIILQEPNAWKMLARLEELGTLKAIHEAFGWNDEIKSRLELGRKSPPDSEWGIDHEIDGYPTSLAMDYTLWFMNLPTTTAASLMGRLKVPGWLTKIILAACKPTSEYPELRQGPPSKVVEQLEDLPHLAMYVHFLTTKDKKIKKSLKSYILEWQHVQTITTGHDLRERQIPPGPHYRQILTTLRAAWLDGKISSKKEETALLGKLLDDRS